MPRRENVQYTPTGYWLKEREDRNWLINASTQPLLKTFSEIGPRPKNRDPSNIEPIENQGNQGSCQGHMLSTEVEVLHMIAGGPQVQLSRACAYYRSQAIDGIRGDQGSTLSAGCKVAEEEGLPIESVWPYPNSYNPSPPSEYENSVRYKSGGHAPCEGFDDALTHLWEGQGTIGFGILWDGSIDEQVSRNGGLVTQYRPASRSGGHAIAGLGFREDRPDGTKFPEPVIVVFNSWKITWGDKGKFYVTKSVLEDMIRNQMNVVIKRFGAPTPDVPVVDISSDL